MKKIVKAEKAVQQKIDQDCACYVLISCTKADKEGKIEVQMNYEGDEALAAFLVTSAARLFNDQIDRRESK